MSNNPSSPTRLDRIQQAVEDARGLRSEANLRHEFLAEKAGPYLAAVQQLVQELEDGPALDAEEGRALRMLGELHATIRAELGEVLADYEGKRAHLRQGGSALAAYESATGTADEDLLNDKG